MNIRTCFIALAVASMGASCAAIDEIAGNNTTSGNTASQSAAPAPSSQASPQPAPAAAETAVGTVTGTTATTPGSQPESQAAPSPSPTVADTSGFIAVEDDPLIVDASSVVDGDGIGAITIQWQILDSPGNWVGIASATHQSFTPREEHVGKQLRVVITYVDGQGQIETLVSPASNPVENVNDEPTGLLLLTGIAREGDALVVDARSIADDDGIGAYEISWHRSASSGIAWEPYQGANGAVLPLGQDHVGFSYRAVMTYTDGHNTSEQVISNPSQPVVNIDNPVLGEVAISGNAVEGGFMTVNTSTISDGDGIASLTVSWEVSDDGRNWSSIETPATDRIDLNQSLVGKQVRAKASVIDEFGVETLVYSRSSNTIENVNDAPVGTINIRRVGS